MTLVERAARALCRLEGHPENVKFEGSLMWQSYLPQVIAVLKAIREPSDLMGLGLPADYKPGSHSATQIWQAMIDAALREGDA